MVYLSRIYTKTGDDGSTELGDRSRRQKDDLRVAAYGEVDELNCAVGVATAHSGDSDIRAVLAAIQHDLFDLGADLCVPGDGEALRITAGQVERLEREIDRVNAELGSLDSFVLPGGNMSAASLHFARAVCRRAERTVVTLRGVEQVNPQALIYLNRLSDLLFVLARAANWRTGNPDVLWVPAKNREPGDGQ